MKPVFAFLATLMLVLGINAAAQAQVLPGVGQSTAEAEPVTPPPSPNDVKELLRLLGDDRVQGWLKDAAEAETETAARTTQMSPRDRFQKMIATMGLRVEEVAKAIKSLPELPTSLAAVFEDQAKGGTRVRGLTLIVIFLISGAGLEWLYRQTVQRPLLRLEQTSQTAPLARVTSALQRAAYIFAGLGIFAIGSIGAFLMFDWEPFARGIIVDALLLVLVFRVLQTVSLFFQAPFAPPLRLMPWNTAMARSIHRMVMVLTGIVLLCVAAYTFFARLAEFDRVPMDMAPVLTAIGLLTALVGLLAAWIMVMFAGWRLKLLSETLRTVDARRRIRAAQVTVIALTGLAYLAWALDARGIMLGLLIFGALLLILPGLRAWIDHFFDQATDAQTAEHRAAFERELELFRRKADEIEDPEERAAMVEPEMPDLPDPYAVSRPIVQRALRLAAVVCALLLFVTLWGVNVFDVAERQSTLGRLMRVLFDSIVVILVADLVWTWARTVIDKRLANYQPPEDGSAPGPEARMITLLPLFRTTILVTVLAMVGLSILTSLGINIAPLLAGAGILGIAIGFGTQSLVRDIVSGLFFLIDDAFRVGEYIEVGDLMGTVESISVRSMRIRHHRGKVHTVPYGELKSVTNHSRDWVIMKLEFRVPFDTDLQLVKKLVKKVGAELKDNDFYGPSILSTLKSQGVRRMEEFNMVVGVKFMTKPGEQWLVRRDAYQKVRDAFDANGIRLAERNVKVEIDRDPASLTEEERNAIAAAAQQASQGPDGPPNPIPDEP